jgi:hypothetical protein
MSTRCATRTGVALARREIDDLAERLGIPTPPEARPGADLAVRARTGIAWPAPAPLLRAADGWVHPGPPTAWREFTAMAETLGAAWPDLTGLTTDALEGEAAAWLLPAAAVRTTPAVPDALPAIDHDNGTHVTGATVVVFGTAWATPLVGHVLARLAARVVKIEHPGRPDPFPLRDDLVAGQEVLALDLGDARDRDRIATLVDTADLVVEGHPPRVLANAGIVPSCAVLRIAAFAASDRPGYGPGAEAHGGWAARHDPPRLARTSVADPVAGLVGAVTAVALLAAGTAHTTARISLEGAVGRLLDRERRGE